MLKFLANALLSYTLAQEDTIDTRQLAIDEFWTILRATRKTIDETNCSRHSRDKDCEGLLSAESEYLTMIGTIEQAPVEMQLNEIFDKMV